MALGDVRDTRRAVVLDRCALGDAAASGDPAVLYGGAIAGAFNQRSSKYRRLAFYQRSIVVDWARRDVQQPTINLSS